MLPIIMGLLGPILGKVVDTVGAKLGVDMDSAGLKEKKLEIELEIKKIVAEQERAVQQANLAQIEVNQQEAKHENIFVSGWRPFIGWTCGAALAYHFIAQPLLIFAAVSLGAEISVPAFDMSTLLTVLMGMLGLGAMRTYEKAQGVAGKAIQLPKNEGFVYEKDHNGTIIARKIG